MRLEQKNFDLQILREFADQAIQALISKKLPLDTIQSLHYLVERKQLRLTDRHGIVEALAMPYENQTGVTQFTLWRQLLEGELDKYDAAMVSMSERIVGYKKKHLQKDITDMPEAEAVRVLRIVNSMESELNAFYTFKQLIVQIINEMLRHQYLLYEHFMIKEQSFDDLIATYRHRLNEALKDAHFWYETATKAMESETKMTHIFHDFLMHKK